MKTRSILIMCYFFLMVSASFAQNRDAELEESMTRGKDVYTAQCMSCHMDEGQGIEDVYPPLAKADYLMRDKHRSIHNVIHGLAGEIVVNGKTYNMEMTPFNFLSDQEVSDVLNYIRNSWGNSGEVVTPEEVAAVRQ